MMDEVNNNKISSKINLIANRIQLSYMLVYILTNTFPFFGGKFIYFAKQTAVIYILLSSLNIKESFLFIYQIEQFRHQVHKNYANETDRDISDDYRPVQNLNHRVVQTNDEKGLFYGAGAASHLMNSYLCLLVLLFSLVSHL